MNSSRDRSHSASLLLDVHSRTFAARSKTGTQAGGLDEGTGISQTSAPEQWPGLRLCNLVAQSSRNAEGAIPARGRKGTDRTRH